MFDPCCETIIGGEIYITAALGRTNPNQTQEGGSPSTYEALGDVRLQPSSIERAGGASSAGTIWVTEAARPVRALLTFANRCTPNPMRLFCARCHIAVTIVEKSRGITHSLTDCVIVGMPEINLSTGEVSGIEVICSGANYSISVEDTIEPQSCVKGAVYDYVRAGAGTPIGTSIGAGP